MQCSMTGEPLTEGGDQTEVIDFLSDPDSYPGNLERINRLETHGASYSSTRATVLRSVVTIRLEKESP